MSNRSVPKRKIDSDIFKSYLKNVGLSIRELAKKTDAHERTLRRSLDDKEMSITVLLELCYLFDENAEALFGPDDSISWNKSIGYLTDKERRW